MNRSFCNACDTELVDRETNRPKKQIHCKDIFIFDPHKGAGQINEAHFCGSECFAEWYDKQMNQVQVLKPEAPSAGSKIVGLNGRAL